MSDLTLFAAHARRMSTSRHRVTCTKSSWNRYGGSDSVWPNPDCPGCVTDSDRALWTRLADETDAYLAREPEPDLFGATP